MADEEESWVDSWLSSLKANITGGRVERKPLRPENAKQRPVVRQIIKTAFPNLSTVQAGNLVDFAAPHLAPSLRTKLGANPSQNDVIAITRDIAQNPNVKSLLEGYKKSYEREIGIPLQRQGRGENEYESNKPRQNTFNSSQLKLRSHYIQAGAETATETIPEAVSDIVQSDLFSYNTANPENGVNNSVYIETELNEQANLVGANIPRPPDKLEQLVGLSSIPWQWRDTIDVEANIEDLMHDAVVQSGLVMMPPVSVTLKDRMPVNDPFGLPRVVNPFIPVNSLQPGFQKDYTQGTEFGHLDRIGFKRQGYDTWRFPREPSQFLPGTRPIDEATSMQMQDDDGITVPMAFASVPAPRAETTTLHGEGFLPSSLFV